MTPVGYPIDSVYAPPSYNAFYVNPHDADPSAVHPNRYSLYYQDDVVERSVGINDPNNLPTTYTVRALLPSVVGGFTVGQIVKTGAVVLTTTTTINAFQSFRKFTLGTAGAGHDFPFGAYRVYLTGTSSDANYGPSYGVSQFNVLRTHASAVDIRTLNSTFATFNWKPSGYGRTDAEVDSGQGGGGSSDMILRAAISMGVGRTEMYGNADAGNTGKNFNINGGPNKLDQVNASLFFTNVVGPYWLNPTAPVVNDPVRERVGWINYVYYFTSYDAIFVTNDGTGGAPPYFSFMNIYPKTPSIDTTKVYVKVTQTALNVGKLEVYYPNSSTLVETYTGLTQNNIADTINGVSAYVKAWTGGAPSPLTMSTPTVIGNNCSSQLTALVRDLAPLGCTRFELPENEPGVGEEVAHQFWLGHAAVQAAGIAGVKAIGPCPVSLSEYWPAYLPYLRDVAGLTKNEFGISTHDYNMMTGGNFNQGRNTMEPFLAILKTYGYDGIELWQTEGNHSYAGLHGCYVPWRASEGIHKTLLWEQYGFTREKNTHWYDPEHGFWGFATFLEGRGHVSMQWCVLYSVLGQETFGQNHHHRVDFGSVTANHMFMGSLYGKPLTGSTMVLCCTSDMPNSTVTLTITGTTSPITIVDGVGATTTVAQNSGMITVPTSYVPTYVRLPAGVTASVYRVRDWENNPNPSVSSCFLSTSLGGAPAPGIATGAFMTDYNGDSTYGLSESLSPLPDSAEIKFNQNFAVDRVTVFCAPPYQGMCGLYTYTVDTWNGTTWTTNTAVNHTPPASFRFGDVGVYGTYVEQMYDGGWVEDITLSGGPITCKGIRIHVTAASYGGAVDSLADSITNGWGDSTSIPKITLQRIDIASATAFSNPSGYAATVLADSPVAYFKLDESSAPALSQVNGLSSSSIQNVGFGAGAIVPSAGGTSVVMNPRPVITIPNNALFDVGDTFTFEAWVYPTDANSFFANLPDGVGLFDKNVGQSGSFQIKIGKNFSFYNMGGGNTLQLICRATSQLPVVTSLHLVVTKSGSTVKMYINAQDVTGTVTNYTISNNTSVIQIGDTSQSVGYDLAHVAIYPTALSAAAVANHYLAGVAPNGPANVHAPFVEGAAVENSQIQCSMNTTIDWTNSPTRFTYQWQSSADGVGSWSNISSETRSDLVIPTAQVGNYLKCLVTGSNPVGSTSAVASATVGPVTTVGTLAAGYWGQLMSNNQIMTLPIALESDSTDCS